DVSAMVPNMGKLSGQTWGGGDFNGDGAVNFSDVSALVPNLGKSVSGLELANPGITGSPTIVTGDSVSLIAPGQASWSYAWTAPTSPLGAAVNFTPAAAQSTVATFTEAGTYSFQVAITGNGA